VIVFPDVSLLFKWRGRGEAAPTKWVPRLKPKGHQDYISGIKPLVRAIGPEDPPWEICVKKIE